MLEDPTQEELLDRLAFRQRNTLLVETHFILMCPMCYSNCHNLYVKNDRVVCYNCGKFMEEREKSKKE